MIAAVLAITLFGVPLGVAVARYYQDDERAELEQVADIAALTVASDLLRGTVPRRLPATEAGTSVALYRPDGTRRLGDGPPALGGAASRIAPDEVITADTASELALLVAVSDGDRVVGVIRVAAARGIVYERTTLTWLGMAGLAVLAVAGAWLIARRQARRLAHPLENLSGAAQQLGSGDFTVTAPRSGIAEIDSVGESLDVTARRLSDLLARERAFSADASHQLRTPLAGLRLQLEAALDLPDAELRASISDALATADRLECTVEDLLNLARTGRPSIHLAPVGTLLAQVERDWRGLLGERGRALRVDLPDGGDDHLVAAPVLRQIMTVLLDNALRHGRGTVTVTVRDVGVAIAVDVADEGPGIGELDPFEHGNGARAPGRGIGLPLARRLAEAEAGRLWLAAPAPPTFTLVLPVQR